MRLSTPSPRDTVARCLILLIIMFRDLADALNSVPLAELPIGSPPPTPSSVFLAQHRHRRHIGAEMLWIYKQRVRRAEPDCSNEAETNADLQQALATMITGNDAKQYFMRPPVPTAPTGAEASVLCEVDELPEDISPDTPIRDRALCSFQYVDNYNKKRLPQTIPEVQCVCSKPTRRMLLERFPEIYCEPVYYDVPVLKFESGCEKYTKTTERISLACLPAFGGQSQSEAAVEVSMGRAAQVPI